MFMGMTGARDLPFRLQPVTEIPQPSHSQGRCGVFPRKGSSETQDSAAGEAFPLNFEFIRTGLIVAFVTPSHHRGGDIGNRSEKNQRIVR